MTETTAPAASFMEAYRRKLEEGWVPDASQRAAVGQLNQLLNTLKAGPSKPPKGLYLHGPVGRGKSQLLNLFVEHAAPLSVRRTHMHAFMGEVHRRLHAIKKGDPIHQLARELRQECEVLGFDEFYITNIADAILLGRLFQHVFNEGVVVVATSNWPMEDLYLNGRNRRSFLPFLRLLQHHLQPVDLAEGRDYRQPERVEWPLYLVDPLPGELEELFDRHADGPEVEAPRPIVAKKVRGRCGWYVFDDLCRRALGRAEYAALTDHLDTVIIEGLPRFSKDEPDAVLRLVTLIDICYERHKRVIVSAAAYPDELYPDDGPVLMAFRRTASRLVEMQRWAGPEGELSRDSALMAAPP
jgi:cell division protein ZapE